MNTTNDNTAFEQITRPTSAAAPTTEKVKTVAHAAVDNTAARAEAVERELRTKAAEASSKASQTQEAAQEQLDRSLEKVKNFAQARPAAAAGIAFAAGVLATTLLRK